MQKTVVLARYKENVNWANKYNPVIIQKDEDVPNVGREPSSYIWYIIQNYDKLEGKYFFLQASPSDHCPRIGEELENLEGDFRWFSNRGPYTCDMMARPHDTVDISSFINEAKLSYSKDKIEFMGCCLFMVSAERIKERSKEFYQNLYDVLMKGEKREYAFERCVGIIFGDKDD